MEQLALLGGEPVKRTPFAPWPLFRRTGASGSAIDVLESRIWWRTPGTQTAEFEQDFAAYQQAKYGIAVTNGTAALEILARRTGHRPGR